jgi:uncharacterized membrane protein
MGLKIILKLFVLFLIGGFTYFLIEILWRGYSHWTMFCLGSIVFLLLDGVNEYLSWETPLWKQGLIGTGIIYLLEFVVGVLVNIYPFQWHVWNYEQPFNLLGQICPQMFPLWFSLAIIGIIFGDTCRWLILKEEVPRYKLF